MFRTKAMMIAGMAALCCSPLASAERADLQLGALYGISQSSGELVRYDLYYETLDNLGAIHLASGQELHGVAASAYRQGYSSFLAFWTDPETEHVYLTNVGLETGLAELASASIDEGYVTGSTAVRVPNASGQGSHWEVFALQHAQQLLCDHVSVGGEININPNNSPHNEFELVLPEGVTVTLADGSVVSALSRDDIKNNMSFDEEGVVYRGPASQVVVKPKGNGNQNGLVVDGQPYALSNSTTYVLSGEMDVVLYNDHIHSNGKAMGHWWISIDAEAGVVGVEGDGHDCEAEQVIDQLISVDVETGQSTHLMPLSRRYDGLAGSAGASVFYATQGDTLYRLDTDAGTETAVGSIGAESSFALEMVGEDLLMFDDATNHIRPIDESSGAAEGDGVHVDIDFLGTIFYADPEYDPVRFAERVMYD